MSTEPREPPDRSPCRPKSESSDYLKLAELLCDVEGAVVLPAPHPVWIVSGVRDGVVVVVHLGHRGRRRRGHSPGSCGVLVVVEGVLVQRLDRGRLVVQGR